MTAVEERRGRYAAALASARLDAILAVADEETAQLQAEIERLAHLLGSHVDGHRCSCEMTFPGSHISPPEWEQDPWCPTHPDVDYILDAYTKAEAERDALRAAMNHPADDPECLTSPCRYHEVVAERDALQRQVDRVRALHYPFYDDTTDDCVACTDGWPCPTIAALDAVEPADQPWLCSQCGEMPSVMVKIGTSDGWCTRCLDEASEPADQPHPTDEACKYRLQWADEVGSVWVCRVHGNNSRHHTDHTLDLSGSTDPCLTVDPYPCDEAGS